MPVEPHFSAIPVGSGHLGVVSARVQGEAAAVFLRFAAGALDEAPDEHGLAHLLEHMLFKGTPTRGIGEAARAIEALGGDLNAYTSHDELALHAVVSAGAWRLALDVIVDMVRAPRLDPAELERERPVILEEIASYDDDPDDALAEAVQAALWPAHPYGRAIIGTRDTVRTLPHEAIRAFLTRELAPERATIVVVADVDHAAVVAAVEALVAGWPAGAPRRAPPAPPHVEGPLLVRPEGSFDDLAIELAWRGPPPGHPDLPALEVLAAILGSTAGDRLTEALDEEPKVGFAGWAEVSTALHGGTLALGFRPLPGRTVDALGRVRDVILRVQRGCRGRLCARARETLLADLDFAEQTVDGIAEDLLHHTVVRGDPRARAAWREALAAVTPEDVARVARTWMVPERVVLGVLDAETSAVSLRRAIGAPVLPRRTPGPGTHVVGGTRIIVQSEESPVVAVRVLAPGGALWTPDGQAGIAEAWSRTIHRGAGRYDGEALHDALDDLATELHPSGGRAGLSISATAPARHAADLLELIGELVLDPHFEDTEWALVREEMQDGIRTRLDRPHEVVDDETSARRFPGHPWRHPGGGTLASLAKLQGKSLARFHDQHTVQGRLVLVVVGGIGVEEALDALSWLEDLPAGKAAPPEPAWPRLQPGVVHVRAGSRQSVVSLTGEGAPFETPRGHTLDIVETLLDGQAGRLFLDLREGRGLAYELWARHDAARTAGLFQLGAACDPARIEEVSEALRAGLASLASQPPDEEELSRARALLLGQETLRQQRAEHRAARLASGLLYHHDPSLAARRTALMAVSRDGVVEAVEAILAAGFLDVRSLPREDR